ncbi:MAG: Lrp/AsnC family transcriptional regulator [Pseudomonadota bacterium]
MGHYFSNMQIDGYDISILREVQDDADLSVDALAERVNLSRNATWRRLKLLREAGIIRKSVSLIDAEKVGSGLTALVFIRTTNHEPQWLEAFDRAIRTLPEIVEALRMSGDLDYMLKVRVRNVKAYDDFYQRMIRLVPLADVSASFVMEAIKETSAVPISTA